LNDAARALPFYPYLFATYERQEAKMRYSIAKTLALLMLSIFFVAIGATASPAIEEDSGDNAVVFTSEETSLSGIEMETNRGAFGVTTFDADQSLAATTSGNSLNVGGNLQNGNIAIGDHLGGFGSYVLNTGNNSTINSAVAVNVQMAPHTP
jgi:hypothetical protein